MDLNLPLMPEPANLPAAAVPAPQAQEALNPQEAHHAYIVQQRELREARAQERRRFSGLYTGEHLQPEEETPLAKESRLSQELQEAFSESPAILKESTEAFCKSLCRYQNDERRTKIHKRREELLQAKAENAARLQDVKPLLPKTSAPAPTPAALKTKIAEQTELLTQQVQSLQEGQSTLLAGSYGKSRSITQELLQMGTLFMGKNIQALPPVLREAFKKGAPNAETLMQGLFSIIHAKRDTWTTDPAAQRIIDLFTEKDEAKRATFIAQLSNWVADWGPDAMPLLDLRASTFLSRYPQVIPQALKGRDALLKALIPTENNALHALMDLALPPTLAARFARPEDAPKTVEELVKLFLEHVYEHVNNQLSENKEANIKEAITGLLETWKNSKLLTFLSGNAFSVDRLIEHWASLKEKKQESPAAFAEELGKITLSLMGEVQTDPNHYLQGLIDSNLEPMIRGMLTQLPAHLRGLTQDALLSPNGEYLIKCVRKAGNLYDVEVYASGPLLNQAPFEGKWPISFQDVPPAQLNREFFQALLQSTLAAQGTAPFSSSPEQFKDLLLSGLGTPMAAPMAAPIEENQAGHVLSNSRLSPTEMAHLYLSHDHQALGRGPQNPAVTQLLWQYERLTTIASQQVQNGTLNFATTERAKAMEAAYTQLLYAANGMQQYPEIKNKIACIQATCQEIEYACEAAWKRDAENLAASAASAPTPTYIPPFIKPYIKPHFAKLKKGVESAERFLKHLPFSKSWVKAGRKVILEKVFNMTSQEATALYDLANREFPIPAETPAELSVQKGILSKAFKLIHRTIEHVGYALGIVYDMLHACLHSLFSLLPSAVREAIARPAAILNRWLEKTLATIQESMVKCMLAPIMHYYMDEALLRDVSAFSRHYVRCMSEHPLLSFEVPAGMADGEYPATDFTAQLFPLSGFASLDKIQVTVLGGKMTQFSLPDVQGAFILEEREGVSEFIHPQHGTLCIQQNDPKLAAFHPYLLVENAAGQKSILLREVLASDQMTDFVAGKQLGRFLWNGAKTLVPQSTTKDVLYKCELSENQTHLTSNDPKALLYIVRSYLLRNDNEAAYYAYKDFERHLQDSPRSMPEDLATRLIPLALSTSETAAKIRLSLFTMLEQQRLSDPEAAKWNNHPLYGTLWMLLCADLHKANRSQNMLWMLLCGDLQSADQTLLDDPRFPDAQEQTPILRNAMLERIQEHLPFYTAQEMGDLLKQLFHLEGTISPEILQTLMSKALPYIETAGVNMLPKNAQPVEEAPQGLVGSLSGGLSGLMRRGLRLITTPLINQGIQEIPNLMTQAPHLIPQLLKHTALEPQEQATLVGFFAQENPPQERLELPELSSATLKSHFWDYYRIFYQNCLVYDGNYCRESREQVNALKLPLILLQQESAHDPEIAILTRILKLLLKLSQDESGDHLHLIEQFHPDKMRRILSNGEVETLVSRFTELLGVPSQTEGDNALRRCSSVAQLGLDLRDVASYMGECVGSVGSVALPLKCQARNAGGQVWNAGAAILTAGARQVNHMKEAVQTALQSPAVPQQDQEHEALLLRMADID